MSEVKMIAATIHGTHPLLQHNPAAMLRGDGAKVGVKKIPSREEEAARGAYRAEDGTFYHPAEAFRKALIDAGVGRKIGKHAATTTLQRSVFITHDRATLIDPDTGEPLTEYTIDERSVVVQGNRVMRARPRWDSWACEIEFELFDDFEVDPPIVRQMLDLAGRIEGVGDYRPSSRAGTGRGGPFGRFAVADMSVS